TTFHSVYDSAGEAQVVTNLHFLRLYGTLCVVSLMVIRSMARCEACLNIMLAFYPVQRVRAYLKTHRQILLLSST
ncbi:MAG: hypothetical protein ACUVSW_18845, partial [Roseiflexus sp.]